MPSSAAVVLLILFLALFLLSLLAELAQTHSAPLASAAGRRIPRPLRPRTPDDCPACRAATAAPPPAPTFSVAPYSQLKSRRGRKKTLNTQGYACPNATCLYFSNTDPAVHALVGYGHHGCRDPIQDFFCQACHRKFSARRHTALYGLKTPAAQVAQVLHAVAEGLSAQAAARVFRLSETTVRSWATRAGLHSRSLHDRLMRSLHPTHLQLDELRIKVRGQIEAAWLWVACDACTKAHPRLCPWRTDAGPRPSTRA